MSAKPAAAAKRTPSQLTLLMRAAEALLLAATDEREVLRVAVALLGERFGYSARGVMLYDPAREDLYVGASAGMLAGRPEIENLRIPLGKGIAGIAARERRLINTPEVPTDPRRLMDVPEVASSIHVPIVARDELLGLLVIASPEPAAFSAEDERLLHAFSQLVALALVHARAHQGRGRDLETVRAQLAELEAFHEVSQRAASLDIDSTLRVVMAKIHDLTTSDSTGVWMWREDEEALELAALVHHRSKYPPDYEERTRAIRVRKGEGLIGWVAEHRQPVFADEVAKDPRARAIPGIAMENKSAIVVPILAEDRLLGVIRAIKMGVNSYNEDHCRLALTLANQAALAIAAADAHRAQSAHIAELGVLYETSRRLAEATTLGEVLECILDGAVQLAGAEAGLIWRRQPDGSFALASARNVEADAVGALPPDPATSLSTEMLRTGSPMVLADIQSGPRLPRYRSAVPHLHALLGAPLRSEGVLYGSLYVLHSRPGFFTPRHLRHLEVLAGLAASAFARAEAFEETHRLAITDDLTGCYNSRYFTSRLSQEVERAKRYGHSLALVMIDSDSLKRVNDMFGHEEGNRHLVQVATTVRENVRATDIVARFGGDEFLILQPETEVAAALLTAERIRETLNARPFVSTKGETIPVSVSGGVAAFPATARDAEELFRQVDDALYLAKRRGKNHIAAAPPVASTPT